MNIRAAVVLLVLVGPGIAHERVHVNVVPRVYDPDHTHRVFAGFFPEGHHERLLFLVKDLPTDADAAAGAILTGVDGATLDGLAFDALDLGRCSNGAPRYDVTTQDGTLYFFGCAFGEHSPGDEPGFTHVRFGDGDAIAQFSDDPPWPGFGHAEVQAIEIVFDEGTDEGNGFAALDDIEVDAQR